MLHATQARRVRLIAIDSFAVQHHERDLLAIMLEEALRDPLIEQMILMGHIDEPISQIQRIPPLLFVSA